MNLRFWKKKSDPVSPIFIDAEMRTEEISPGHFHAAIYFNNVQVPGETHEPFNFSLKCHDCFENRADAEQALFLVITELREDPVKFFREARHRHENLPQGTTVQVGRRPD